MAYAHLPGADERTARLLGLLDLEARGDDVFTGRSRQHVGPRTFGGQVLAQALVAAARTVPDGRAPHSLHGYFLRPGDPQQSIDYAVEQLRDGRSFSARRVQAIQGGVPILSMIASFESPADGPDHCETIPTVPPPTDLPSLVDTYGGVDDPTARYWAFEQPLDLRFATPSIFVDPLAVPDATTRIWWRVAGELPDDPLLHAAVLVYASDYSILEPVLRRHGRSWLRSGFTMASIDHALWFHRAFRADDWLLLDATSPSAQRSRGLNTARMFAADGTLVASVAQEGLYRPRN